MAVATVADFRLVITAENQKTQSIKKQSKRLGGPVRFGQQRI